MGEEVNGEESGADVGLAPVIPLFGGADATPGGHSMPDSRRRPSGTRQARTTPEWRTEWDDDPEDAETPDDVAEADGSNAAFDRLLRKLRRRGLSVAEATSALIADGVDRAAAEGYVAELQRRRWLSDADLAEQLVHAAVARKGEGRRAIAQTLAKRGIPRDIADDALGALPDDDADRALDFARSKARGMAALDRDTALRRLMGQLARRGYPGSVAMAAARQALDEAGSDRSEVRFR